VLRIDRAIWFAVGEKRVDPVGAPDGARFAEEALMMTTKVIVFFAGVLVVPACLDQAATEPDSQLAPPDFETVEAPPEAATLDDMAARSALAVHGCVVGLTGRQDPDGLYPIVTDVELAIERTWWNRTGAALSPTLALVQPGGTADGMSMIIADLPTLAADGCYVLLLEGVPSVGEATLIEGARTIEVAGEEYRYLGASLERDAVEARLARAQEVTP
jgi:hypothetical protein